MQISITQINQNTTAPKGVVNRLWVDYDYFCRCASKLSDYNKRHFKSRGRWNINLKEQVNLFSVSEKDRVRYGIALDNNLILAQIAQLKKEDAEEAARGYAWSVEERKTHHVYEQMQAAMGEFAQYRVRLMDMQSIASLPKERVTEFAKRWAVWKYIMDNYTRFANSLEIYHAAYSIIFPDQFKGANGKISFKNFYDRCEANGIEHTVIDKRTVNKVQKRRSELQMAFLQTMYIQQRKATVSEAHESLTSYCEAIGEKAMSESNVKIIFREFNDNEELYRARYGDAAGQKRTAYTSLIAALHRNTQWQIDGWTMPFWGADFQRYVLYMIRDNHSRKIVGYSVAETENTTLILEGLDDAMRNTGVFPGELVSDKHSFHKTTHAAKLRLETEKMGAVWTVTMNAQRNQLAERYNQYMDAICKDFDGYLGKNITATGKDARPAPEVMAEYAKKGNFKSYEEIKAIATYAVTEFNRATVLPASLTNGIKQTPNERYEASESLKAFPITEAERVRLIKPVTTYKVIRGQITIMVGVRKHEFLLPASLIDRYNNQVLEVTYEDLNEGIYITDIKTGEMLGEVLPKKKAHGAIPDQTEEDRQLFLQIAGKKKGTASKARKTAMARIEEGLLKNPDAIALINTHAIPKDIRQLAKKDSEVKRHLNEQGVNMDKVPIRKVKVSVLGAPATKAKEPKLFAPKEKPIMRKINPQEN